MYLQNELEEFRKTRNLKKFVPLFSKQDRIDDLVEFIYHAENVKLAEYGTWLCTHIVKESPTLLHSHIDPLIEYLCQEQNETLLRNIFKSIIDSKPNKKHDESILNVALNFLEDPKHKVALHVYSIYALLPILKRNQELIPEIAAFLELKTQECSPFMAAAYRKFKKYLKWVLINEN